MELFKTYLKKTLIETINAIDKTQLIVASLQKLISGLSIKSISKTIAFKTFIKL